MYKTSKPYGSDIELQKSYDFEWTEIENRWFLMVGI